MAKVYRTAANNWETEERLINLGELVVDNLDNIRTAYYSSLKEYQEAVSRFDDDDYDEEFDDTLNRKYQEGYSDALAMILDLLKEAK